MQSLQTFFGTSAGPSINIRRRSPIDVVTYVASLASNPREIDPILDDFRLVTSNLNPGQLPDKQATSRLSAVYFKIEDYLTHKEPLRAFTKETLREKVAKKFDIRESSIEEYWKQTATPASVPKPVDVEVAKRVDRTKKLGSRIVIGALVISFISFFLPANPSPEVPYSNNFNMAFSVGASLLLFGGVWLFFRGLGGFKTQLKVVYGLLCGAMILLALAQSQQVIYTALDLWGVDFIRQGGIAMGYIPCTVLFYLSMHRFARLLNVRSMINSVWVLLIVSVVIAGLAAVLPIPSPLSPEALRIALPPSLILATVIGFAATIVLPVKNIASAAYTRALAWLFVGLASIAAIALLFALLRVFIEGDIKFLSYGGISLLFAAAAVMLVRSAVAFNFITED